MNREDFKKLMNEKRKGGGKFGKWYGFVGEVEGKYIEIKAFKTWLQIFRVDGRNYFGGMDVSVAVFNETLLKPFI